MLPLCLNDTGGAGREKEANGGKAREGRRRGLRGNEPLVIEAVVDPSEYDMIV